MSNILSQLFASAYSGLTPLWGAVSATCTVNGQSAPCPAIPGIFLDIFWFFYFAFLVFYIVAMWRVFVKAGKPGWAAIVPIYNTIVTIQIAGKPIWWIILFFIPIVNIIIGIIVVYNLAKNFGRGDAFTLGLIFLPIVFYPILAFGKSVYMPLTQAPSVSATPSSSQEIPPQV